MRQPETPLTDNPNNNMNSPQTDPFAQTPPQTASPQLTVLPAPAASKPVEGQTSKIPQPVRKLTRNGRIARLPYLERDMVNRMLRNNIAHGLIVEALREHEIRVTVRNVSNWKTRGGYNEWCREQDRALDTRLRQDNLLEFLRKSEASQLPEIGLQLAATQLSEFFLNPETQQQLAASPEKHARTVAILCRLASQIHTLQKYRDACAKELGYNCNPERIKRKEEADVEITRSVYSAEKLGGNINESDVAHRNYIPKK